MKETRMPISLQKLLKIPNYTEMIGSIQSNAISLTPFVDKSLGYIYIQKATG